ncbi:hypothetical protein [Candidatus Williamhamiltonella defendens]|nr:hypothetical protein [Candidatus Hamiltonella defensa]
MTIDVNENWNTFRSEIADMKQLLAQCVENTLSDGGKANLPPSDKEYLTA